MTRSVKNKGLGKYVGQDVEIYTSWNTAVIGLGPVRAGVLAFNPAFGQYEVREDASAYTLRHHSPHQEEYARFPRLTNNGAPHRRPLIVRLDLTDTPLTEC